MYIVVLWWNSIPMMVCTFPITLLVLLNFIYSVFMLRKLRVWIEFEFEYLLWIYIFYFFLQQNGKGWAAWLCIWPFGTAWELLLYNGVNFVCHTTNCKILLFLFLKVKERHHPCIYPMVMNVSMNPLVKKKSKERFCTTKIFFFYIMNACIT